MAAPTPNIYYKKTPGFATTKGQMYEAKVSALLFLRGVNSGIDFQLATNVEGAGALDDVVFRIKEQSDEWTSFFVQLKHKENSWITRRMLTDPKGSFSLQKYCESYEDIKRAMSTTRPQALFDGKIEDSNFIIFTNARPNLDLGKECSASDKIIKFLGSNSGNVFNFDPDGVTEAERAVSESLKGCLDFGRDFLKRLRIFATQPSEAEFDSFIKKELEKAVCDFKSIDIDRLFVCFMENVKTWCEEKRNVLDRESDLLVSARDRVLAETYSLFEIEENKLDLMFEKDALSAMLEVLSGESPVVHIGSSEQTSRLTFTKLLQTFETSTYLFFGSKSFLSNQKAVMSEWGRGRHNTLIVSVNNRDLVTDQCHFDKIVELCKMAAHSKKRLVILTNSKVKTDKSLEYLEDFFKFSSLTTVSRNDFLSAKFLLQGRPVSLEAFLTDSLDDDVLSGSFVVEIIESGSRLSVGSVITDPDKHYRPRSLHPPKAKVLRSLFQVETLPETIAIVNSTTSDIVELFFQNETSFSKQHLHKCFLFSGFLSPEKGNEKILIGTSFSVGKFECNFVGLSSDKPCALRFLPLKDGRPLSACWFLFAFQGTSESDVEKVAEFHCARHFLMMKNLELTLSKSLSESDFIREHIELFRPKNLVDSKDRVEIVCGEPGMGKTTLMRHLAQRTMETIPYLWVILISLNDHTQLFAEGKHENAFEFLSAAAEIKPHLERVMFELALKLTGNVVVILDGYDEIAPKYIDHCCQLLSSLIKTKAKKVWVTTRISVRDELERHMSKSAARLCKFSKNDQRNYLKRYWSSASELALASGKEVLSDEKLNGFIDRLFQKTFQSIRDWENDFLAIPLQAQIMAEVFTEHVTSPLETSPFPDKLDWLQLLDLFIDKKLEVHVQDKLKIKPADTNYEILANSIRPTYLTNHMEASIRLILPEKYESDWQSKKLIGNSLDFFEKIKSGAEKTGFIYSIINGKAHFVHRVFAEYFVAKWFASYPEEYAKFIVEESFHAFAGGYVVSRYLCDLILAKDCELHTAVLNGDVSKVKELLMAGADVNARDLGGRTPLHLTAAFGHMDSTQARHVEILDLLIQTPGIDFEITDELVIGTPLRYADLTKYWLMIDKLLAHNVKTEQLKTILLQLNTTNLIECILSYDLVKLFEFCVSYDPDFHNRPILMYSKLTFKGCGLLAHACQHGNIRIVKLLIERGYNINGKTQPFSDTHYPPLHCACLGGHLEIVKLLVNASKRAQTMQLLQVNEVSHPDEGEFLLKTMEQGLTEGLNYVEQGFINRMEERGHTALHLASANGYVDIVTFLVEHGADVESRDHQLSTCLHFAVLNNRTDVIKIILNVVKGKEKFEFVNLSNLWQYTPLHLAAKAGFLEVVQILVSAGAEMSIDRYKQTPLMLAARYGHFEVIEFLLAALDESNNVKGFRNSLSRTEWLNKKDKDGWTALNLAASFGFQNAVKLLIDRGADTSRRDGPDTGLPKNHEDEEMGYSFMNLCFGKLMFHENSTPILSMGFDDYDNTLLHIAAYKGYLEVVDHYFKQGAKVTSKNNLGQTPLMFAATYGHFYVVEYLLKAFDESKASAGDEDGLSGDAVSTEMTKVEFINMQDSQGATAVYFAACRGHTFTRDLLVKHGADVNILPHVVVPL